MRPCWSCGSTGLCQHREPELIEFYIARLQAQEAVIERADARAAATSRKPSTIAPAASNAFPRSRLS